MPDHSNSRLEPDWRRFQELRENSEISGKQFAAAICNLPVFVTKHAQAVAVLARRHRNAEDAGQTAVLTILRYLRKTRGRIFQGDSAEAFAGWIYCLIRRNILWALGLGKRGDRRRRHHEKRVWRELCQRLGCESQFIRREWLVNAFLKLPLLHRRVLAAWLRREPAESTIRRLGISRRTYYRLRKEAIDRLRKLLRDEDDDCSSLVPA